MIGVFPKFWVLKFFYIVVTSFNHVFDVFPTVDFFQGIKRISDIFNRFTR